MKAKKAAPQRAGRRETRDLRLAVLSLERLQIKDRKAFRSVIAVILGVEKNATKRLTGGSA